MLFKIQQWITLLQIPMFQILNYLMIGRNHEIFLVVTLNSNTVFSAIYQQYFKLNES